MIQRVVVLTLLVLLIFQECTCDKVLSVEVISTITNTKLFDLENNGTIIMSTVPVTSPSQLNYGFVTDNSTMSMKIEYVSLSNSTIKFKRYETVAPFSLCGKNSSGKYKQCPKVGFGSHWMRMTPYAQPNFEGTPGPSTTYTFVIMSMPPTPAPMTTLSPVVTSVPVVTASPVAAPAHVLTPVLQTLSCPIPKLIGNWETLSQYQVAVMESQGTIFPNGDFVVYSGFIERYFTTRAVHALKTSSSNATWRSMDDIPPVKGRNDTFVSEGLTHCSFDAWRNIVYSCGGYVGKTPGPATRTCLKYNHTEEPGSQWSYLPDLPFPRAGGGLLFDSASNTLLYVTGAFRPSLTAFAVDYDDVWELSLSDLNAGWQSKAPYPNKANHVGRVTVMYQGTDRHYVMGGQLGQGEANKNKDTLYEWNRSMNSWMKLRNMPKPRGHISSSVIAYKNCGFLVVAGVTNNDTTLTSILHYNIGVNEWTTIGDLPFKQKTPICDIIGNRLFCLGGSDFVKIEID